MVGGRSGGGGDPRLLLECETPNGQAVKPVHDDIEAELYTDLPAQREQCLGTIDRKIALCRENAWLASGEGDGELGDCLAVCRDKGVHADRQTKSFRARIGENRSRRAPFPVVSVLEHEQVSASQLHRQAPRRVRAAQLAAEFQAEPGFGIAPSLRRPSSMACSRLLPRSSRSSFPPASRASRARLTHTLIARMSSAASDHIQTSSASDRTARSKPLACSDDVRVSWQRPCSPCPRARCRPEWHS